MAIHPLERRWFAISVILLVLMGVLLVYTAYALRIHPPSNVEPIDSTRLHLTPEFAEDRLGVERAKDGSVVVHIVMARYMVQPQEITVPADTPLVIRAASADVLHGLHVAGTNIAHPGRARLRLRGADDDPFRPRRLHRHHEPGRQRDGAALLQRVLRNGPPVDVRDACG